jgi:hypothetical protein
MYGLKPVPFIKVAVLRCLMYGLKPIPFMNVAVLRSDVWAEARTLHEFTGCITFMKTNGLQVHFMSAAVLRRTLRRECADPMSRRELRHPRAPW